MELDRVLYIFGSFSRRRQNNKDKRRSLEPSSLSAGSSPLHLQSKSKTHSRPASSVQNGDLVIAPRTSAYGTSKKLSKEWECRLCRKQLSEPRILACLHNFCTRCLQGLHQDGELEVWNELDVVGGSNPIPDDSRSGSGAGSAGSGYESDLRNHSGSDVSWDSEHKERSHKYGIFTRKISGKSVQIILCPTCGYETQLPLGGIAALPLNSILVRKIANVEGEEDGTSVLCDLCTTDIKAESRCSQCLVSVCDACSDAHARQKATKRHSLQPLQPAPVKHCTQHPRAELCIYCATCQQVICRECCLLSHSGHALANASRAAGERSRLLKDACDRAKHIPDHLDRITRLLHTQAHEDDSQAARVENEVRAWADQYRRAVDTHGRALCAAASRARARYHQRVAARDKQLQERLQQAEHAVKFAEEVLAEGREEEVLSLSGAVLRRLERVTEVTTVSDPPTCELRFAPHASAPALHGVPLVGRLLTRQPDHDKCCLHTDGLQDLRVGKDNEIILELRDNSGDRIWCGGEQVAGFLRRKDSSARPDSATVQDKGDGSYSITIAPPKPGAYLLAVTLNNKPIKGSPFLCGVRVSRGHSGQFHCCAFCSSGGSRDAHCGCGATMSGGYKGCGHGQGKHPGKKHWSCCGSTARGGTCSRAEHATYQFSL